MSQTKHIGAPCRNPQLQQQLHSLKLGETLVTDQNGATLANSISRTLKHRHGTRLSVRCFDGVNFVVTAVKVQKRANTSSPTNTYIAEELRNMRDKITTLLEHVQS